MTFSPSTAIALAAALEEAPGFAAAVTMTRADAASAAAQLRAACAEVEHLKTLHPRCMGKWLRGSGGHRVYDGKCETPGRWNVGFGFVCDEHKETGDYDAWSVGAELGLLREMRDESMEANAERVLMARAECERLKAEVERLVQDGPAWLGCAISVLHECVDLTDPNDPVGAALTRAGLEREPYRAQAEVDELKAEVERMRAVYEAAVAWFKGGHTGDANCAAGDCDDCDARTKEGALRVEIAKALGEKPDWWDLLKAGQEDEGRAALKAYHAALASKETPK